MTEIGDYAFVNCYKLKNINLDMELCYIRDFAFASCRSLDISTINCKFIGKNAFYRCDSLKNINLNVNEVGFFAFSNCKNLQSVRFLKRPYKLDKFAFSKCKSLKDIYLTNGEANVIKSSSSPIVISESCFEDCTSIEQMTFKGKIDLKNSNGLFCGCHNLTEVVFDVASLKSIPSTAFMHCRKLERVEGLGKVKIFARSSFFMCENLLSADLSGATQFENQAFAYCGLQSLNLPSVVTIQENAFALMDNLTKIVIGSKLKQLESNAFYGLHNVKEIEVHSVGFDFYYDSFAEVHPQTVTVRDVDFLFSLLENNSTELKTVYVEEGLLTEDLLSEAPILLIAQVSDKPGFDKFTVDDSNPYLKYVNKRVIVQFKNDERIYTYCNEAGFDEQRGEYYLVLNKKHYQSEIESVMIDPYY